MLDLPNLMTGKIWKNIDRTGTQKGSKEEIQTGIR